MDGGLNRFAIVLADGTIYGLYYSCVLIRDRHGHGATTHA